MWCGAEPAFDPFNPFLSESLATSPPADGQQYQPCVHWKHCVAGPNFFFTEPAKEPEYVVAALAASEAMQNTRAEPDDFDLDNSVCRVGLKCENNFVAAKHQQSPSVCASDRHYHVHNCPGTPPHSCPPRRSPLTVCCH